jgi:hypothetical protein
VPDLTSASEAETEISTATRFTFRRIHGPSNGMGSSYRRGIRWPNIGCPLPAVWDSPHIRRQMSRPEPEAIAEGIARPRLLTHVPLIAGALH